MDYEQTPEEAALEVLNEVMNEQALAQLRKFMATGVARWQMDLHLEAIALVDTKTEEQYMLVYVDDKDFENSMKYEEIVATLA